jgi:hypothetical protein
VLCIHIDLLCCRFFTEAARLVIVPVQATLCLVPPLASGHPLTSPSSRDLIALHVCTVRLGWQSAVEAYASARISTKSPVHFT